MRRFFMSLMGLLLVHTAAAAVPMMSYDSKAVLPDGSIYYFGPKYVTAAETYYLASDGPHSNLVSYLKICELFGASDFVAMEDETVDKGTALLWIQDDLETIKAVRKKIKGITCVP